MSVSGLGFVVLVVSGATIDPLQGIAGDLLELVAEVDDSLDAAVIAPVLHAVAALLLERDDVVEVDVNPVRLTERGAVALDALVVRAERNEEEQ